MSWLPLYIMKWVWFFGDFYFMWIDQFFLIVGGLRLDVFKHKGPPFIMQFVTVSWQIMISRQLNTCFSSSVWKLYDFYICADCYVLEVCVIFKCLYCAIIICYGACDKSLCQNMQALQSFIFCDCLGLKLRYMNWWICLCWQLPPTANWARQQQQAGGPQQSLTEIQQEEQKRQQQLEVR